MKNRTYSPDNMPFVSDATSYCDTWRAWWTSFQPAWRRNKGWPLPRETEETTNWFKLGTRGQSGLFLVVMSTAWWAHSVQSEEDEAKLNEAVDDIDWVIHQVIGSLQSFKAPTPPKQPDSSKNPQNSKAGAPWMTRDSEKRQPRPSRKLLEGAAA